MSTTAGWFEASVVAEGLVLIREPHVHPLLRANTWLVRGRDRDLLVDSGLGILPIRPVVLALTAGLFVIITVSVIMQVGSFKITGRRVFRMAPLHHHFEMRGWPEILIVVRFWIIQGLCIAIAMVLFFAEWVVP